MYTGTGGMPMVQCEHCKNEGRTTLIEMNQKYYDEIACVVKKAIAEEPAKYVDACYEVVGYMCQNNSCAPPTA